jgi:hypothetical protein
VRGTIRQSDRFLAVASDGSSHEIIEFTQYIDVSSRGGHGEAPGLKSYRLANGDSVNAVGDGEFEVVFGGLKLRRPTQLA